MGNKRFLVPYYKFIKELIKQFEEISFEHLPREENYMVYALAMLATMFKINTNVEVQLVKLGVRESLAHCACVEEEIDGKPWYFDILQYVKSQ